MMALVNCFRTNKLTDVFCIIRLSLTLAERIVVFSCHYNFTILVTHVEFFVEKDAANCVGVPLCLCPVLSDFP